MDSATTLERESTPHTRPYAVLGALLATLVVVRLLVALVGLELAIPEQSAALGWSNVALAAVLGGLGLLASARARLSLLGSPKQGAWACYGQPAVLGALMAALVILLDLTDSVSVVTQQAHASFPGIVPLYLYAGLYMGLVLRLGVATLLVWLVSVVLLRDRGHRVVYWITAGLLTALLTAGQLISFARLSSWDALLTPGVLLLFALATAFDLLLYGLYLWRGLLSSLTAHLTYLALWHMLWGGLVAQAL